MVSEFLNGREEIWRSHAQYVATEHFVMLEGFEAQIQAQLMHILSTVHLRGTSSGNHCTGDERGDDIETPLYEVG